MITSTVQETFQGLSSVMTFQSAATATGTGTPYDIGGYATVVVQVTITGSATITYEVSQDGVTYNTISGQNIATIGSNILTSNSSMQVCINVSGFKWFQARISSYTSGSVTVIGYASGTTRYYVPYTGTFGSSDANTSTQTLQGVGGYNLLFDGTNWVRQRAYSLTDASSNPTNPSGTIAFLMGYNGASYDKTRVGKTYKYTEYLNLANATATTVWTPTSGKKFRLMGVQFGASGAAQCSLRDGTAGSGTPIHMFKVGGSDTKDFNFGNGYLSSAANNVLEIYNATGSAISVWVTAWGTEE